MKTFIESFRYWVSQGLGFILAWFILANLTVYLAAFTFKKSITIIWGLIK
jgi:hypothetical protein